MQDELEARNSLADMVLQGQEVRGKHSRVHAADIENACASGSALSVTRVYFGHTHVIVKRPVVI